MMSFFVYDSQCLSMLYLSVYGNDVSIITRGHIRLLLKHYHEGTHTSATQALSRGDTYVCYSSIITRGHIRLLLKHYHEGAHTSAIQALSRGGTYVCYSSIITRGHIRLLLKHYHEGTHTSATQALSRGGTYVCYSSIITRGHIRLLFKHYHEGALLNPTSLLHVSLYSTCLTNKSMGHRKNPTRRCYIKLQLNRYAVITMPAIRLV